MVQRAQMPSIRPDRLQFRFESDEAASFLVLECDAKVLEYQALMLEHNRMRRVLPLDVVIKEGMSCYYYNITSRISLAFFLSRRKLGREEFLKLLLDITSAVIDSAGYLLTLSNFVFDPEYIYISPETLDAMLVYVPAALDGGCGTSLQAFVCDLLMKHINVDGFSDGNLVQRILSEVNSDSFNMKSLMIVLNDLLYSGSLDDRFTPTKKEGKTAQERTPVWEGKLVPEINPVPEGGPFEGKQPLTVKMSGLTILAIAAQMIMGALIYAGRGFLEQVGDNPAATYAAVIMIVLAIEVLLFKKLHTAGMLRVKPAQTASSAEMEQDCRSSGKNRNGGNRGDSENSARTAANRAREMIYGKSLVEMDGLSHGPSHGSSYGSSHGPSYSGLSHGGLSYPERSCESLREVPAGSARDEARNILYKAASEAAASLAATPPKAETAVGRAGSSGAHVTAGATSQPVSSGPAIPYGPPASAGKTELLSGSPKGRRMLKSTRRQAGEEDIYINKEDFIIGRLADHVDHVIKNSAVGKLHVQVLFKDGFCYIKDLNSVNGTFINGKRIESNKEYELKDNDRILLANSEFVYIGG